MINNRRDFIKTVSLATGSVVLSGSMAACNRSVNPVYAKVSQLKNQLYQWLI
jgi:hypothetical protein